MKKYTYLREVKLSYKKKRLKSNTPVGKSITGSRQIYSFFKDLESDAKEKLIAIALDTKLKIVCFEVIAIGSVSTVYSKIGEIMRTPICVNAYAVVIVHNHPTGDPTPSPSDKRFTKEFYKASKILGVTFLDHLIIGEGTYFSFSDENLIL